MSRRKGGTERETERETEKENKETRKIKNRIALYQDTRFLTNRNELLQGQDEELAHERLCRALIGLEERKHVRAGIELVQ